MKPSYLFGVRPVSFVVLVTPVLLGLLSDFARAQGAEPAPEPTRLEELVVTATRTEVRRGDLAQQIEIIGAEQVQETPATFATDLLKKNTSVDVIQYPGGLSGVGLRGFRPQFSGINQQILLLVDGRPAGVTSLGNLPQANVGRVEVVKGSSSSVYGASAMGGVVNFITRRSQGPLQGSLDVRAGSFQTLRAGAHLGGSLSDRVDFDLGFDERSQYDDFDMGDGRRVVGDQVFGAGAERPFTSFETRSLFGRLGVAISDRWRLDVRAHGFMGSDVGSPGPESDGTGDQASNDADVFTFDVRASGRFAQHDLLITGFASWEERTGTDAVDGNLLLSSFGRETEFRGLQLRDSWRFAEGFKLVSGIDYEVVDATSTRIGAGGNRIGSFSPDERRETAGVYADLTWTTLEDRLILNGGLRADRIESELRPTVLRPDFVPGSSTFDTVNPRAGIVFYPRTALPLRLHASVGRGFVVPQVREIAGATDDIVGSQRRVTIGNPDLDPESSVSIDFGVGIEGDRFGADLTWFRMDIDDAIESVFTVNTSEYRETTYVNASSALAQGLEGTLQGDLSGWIGLQPGVFTVSSTATYYFDREQELPSGTAPLRNVARFKVNGSVDYDDGRFGVRLTARHANGMIDRDFSVGRIFTGGTGGAFVYPDVTILDVDFRYYLTPQQTLGFQVENLTDRYYFEKNDYPMQGRMLLASYRYSF